MPSLQQLQFFDTVNSLHQLPPSEAEVAFAGRSNSGKSSALNVLAHHKRLAFVSKTPGRTQHINFFIWRKHHYVVDLPGYGYARVPAAMRAHWQQLLSRYLQTREALKGLVLIMDIRHPLTQLDQQMIHWFCATGKPIHILLTKSDKLSRLRAKQQCLQVSDALAHHPDISIQLFSSLTRAGAEEAEQKIMAWLS